MNRRVRATSSAAAALNRPANCPDQANSRIRHRRRLTPVSKGAVLMIRAACGKNDPGLSADLPAETGKKGVTDETLKGPSGTEIAAMTGEIEIGTGTVKGGSNAR